MVSLKLKKRSIVNVLYVSILAKLASGNDALIDVWIPNDEFGKKVMIEERVTLQKIEARDLNVSPEMRCVVTSIDAHRAARWKESVQAALFAICSVSVYTYGNPLIPVLQAYLRQNQIKETYQLAASMVRILASFFLI